MYRGVCANVCADDIPSLALPAENHPTTQTGDVETPPLQILYQDDYLVAIHKPSGLLVHRSPVDRRETRFAMAMLRDQLGRWVYPVHRLDKPTSGVLLFAFDAETAKQVGSQFEQQSVRKRYLAIVRGHPPLGGIIRHAIADIDDLNSRRKRPDAEPQPALTLYHRLATRELPVSVDKRYSTSRYALMDLAPRSGRRHQLRRHLKHISHPIIGDTTYGKGPHNRFFKEQFGVDRLLLAAYQLSLSHPETGAPLTLQAPLEGRFLHAVTALDWLPELPSAARPDPTNPALDLT